MAVSRSVLFRVWIMSRTLQVQTKCKINRLRNEFLRVASAENLEHFHDFDVTTYCTNCKRCHITTGLEVRIRIQNIDKFTLF